MGAKRGTVEERFWRHVDQRGADDCWLWTGALTGVGYPSMNMGGRSGAAHRLAWALAHPGEEPPRVIDHWCHTSQCTAGNRCPHRACVNPRHLVASDYRSNTMRGSGWIAEVMRTDRCRKGHELTEDNVRIERRANGITSRRCRTCKRDKDRRYREEGRAWTTR